MFSSAFRLFTLFIGLCLCVPSPAAAQGQLSPRLKPGGGKWRIGYYEGGAYNDYAPVAKATAARLVELGWIKPGVMECLKGTTDSAGIWACLSGAESDFVEFPADAYWSADWKDGPRQERRADFMRRAKEKHDLDLVLAMGTWAGQDLAANDHDIPTLVCSTSNAVASGIIKSPEDSGFDHVHARVDPTRYARQIKLFHDIVGFKKLGLVFERSKEGISYAGLDQITPLANQLGFELVTCEAPFSDVSLEEAQKAVLACHEELAPKVDAFYITIHRGVNKKGINALLKPLFEYKIPTFAMGTLYEVNAGAMMSMAQPDFKYAGVFYGDVAARILNGERPRDISQILPDPQDVRINIETARRIGFHIPVDALSDAEETIDVIENLGDETAPPAK